MVTDNTSAAQSPAGADMVLLREAAAAYKSDDKEKARALLVEAASINPDNELVWMWRTSLARSVEEALEAVHRVLALNPVNERALGWQAKLQARAAAAQGAQAESNGAGPAEQTPGTEQAVAVEAEATAETADSVATEDHAEAEQHVEAEGLAEAEEGVDEQPVAEQAEAEAAELQEQGEDSRQAEVESAEADSAAELEDHVEHAAADALVEESIEEDEQTLDSQESIETEAAHVDNEDHASDESHVVVEGDDSVDEFFAQVEQAHADAADTESTLESQVEVAEAEAPVEESAATEEDQAVAEDDDPLRSLLAEKATGEDEHADSGYDDVFSSSQDEDSDGDEDRSQEKAASLAALLGGDAEPTADETDDAAAELTEVAAEESESIHSLWHGDDDASQGDDSPLAEEPAAAAEVTVDAAVDVADTAAAAVVTSIEEKTAEWECPICEQQSERREMACPQCRSIVDYSRLPAMAENDEVDRVLLKRMISTWESEVEHAPSAELHSQLALAHLNLRQSNEALPHLLAGARLDRHDNEIAGALEEVTRRPLIMVVDDSRTVQRMVASTLERQLYRVSIAEDGLQALAKLNDELPALILLDITMPRMDGYQVCKVITGNQAFKHIPVVMLSGKDGFFDKVRGKMVGASDYITKPFEGEFLVKAVRARLKN